MYEGPFPNRAPVVCYRGPPLLAVVVDAEEEFEWAQPLTPQHRTTVSIRAQRNAHTLFAYYGIKPIYLVTYPLAAEDNAIGVLREYLAAGACEIGAQLHPWVTPPFIDGAGETQSYPGNLPVALEREKLARLVGAIDRAFALRPTVYKAGRYGFGSNTSMLLEEAGFEVDTSLIPRTSYAESGGPDFTGYDYRPFWFGHHRRILELPVTRALTGVLAQTWPALHQHTQRRPWRSLHAGGLLSRAGLIERITLSPEGSDLAAMCRLTRVLLARGTRVLTLSYHSPSLEPGHTPYVRNDRDLAIFLDRLSGFLSFFREEIGGEFVTVDELRQRLSGGAATHAPLAPHPARLEPARLEPAHLEPAHLEPAPGRRCLVVANTFPPVHGGSAVVYDSLARFGRGRVSVLAPRQDYRYGWPVRFWREFDRAAPFRVHRIHLLRTGLLDAAPSLPAAYRSLQCATSPSASTCCAPFAASPAPSASISSASANWWPAAGLPRFAGACSACAALSMCTARKSAAAWHTTLMAAAAGVPWPRLMPWSRSVVSLSRRCKRRWACRRARSR